MSAVFDTWILFKTVLKSPRLLISVKLATILTSWSYVITTTRVLCSPAEIFARFPMVNLDMTRETTVEIFRRFALPMLELVSMRRTTSNQAAEALVEHSGLADKAWLAKRNLFRRVYPQFPLPGWSSIGKAQEEKTANETIAANLDHILFCR